MRRLFQSIKPRARGWELGWLVLLQAVAGVFLVYPVWDPFFLREDLVDLLVGRIYGLAEYSGSWRFDFTFYEIIDRYYYDDADPTGSTVLVVALWVYVKAIVLLLAWPLVWAWLPQPWRAIGWSLLALSGFWYLYCLYPHVFIYTESIIEPTGLEQAPAEWFPWLQDAIEPALTALAAAYVVLGLFYSHLGRILFAKVKRPPPQTSEPPPAA